MNIGNAIFWISVIGFSFVFIMAIITSIVSSNLDSKNKEQDENKYNKMDYCLTILSKITMYSCALLLSVIMILLIIYSFMALRS